MKTGAGWTIVVAAVALAVVMSGFGDVAGGPAVRISIATGTTGGVYFPLGGGLASLISKHIPGVTATAEVTPASVDNMRLIQAKRTDVAMTLADTASDAFRGEEAFRGSPIPIRTLVPLYNNFNHLITMEGTGIATMSDLRGKRVSVGPPGSGTEVTAVRILEAAGLHPDRDIRRERLGPAPSADAMKDRKIDAFFWSGGLPTASVLDLAVSPGVRIRLIPMDALVPVLQRKYGNLYFRSVIQKEFYPGMPTDAPTIGVANLLVVHQDFDAELAYQITKLVFERRPDLAQVHKEAANITLIGAAAKSPVPYHPGAIRYYRERNVEGF
ncbi:MAG: TAXI family TRAP transporter solute-binding subunit [Candidatus Methylomirabilaceae bacterium]